MQRRITQERVPTASKAGSRDLTWAGVRRSVRALKRNTQNSKLKTQNSKPHSDAVRISGEAICHSLPVDKTTDLCT